MVSWFHGSIAFKNNNETIEQCSNDLNLLFYTAKPLIRQMN